MVLKFFCIFMILHCTPFLSLCVVEEHYEAIALGRNNSYVDVDVFSCSHNVVKQLKRKLCLNIFVNR